MADAIVVNDDRITVRRSTGSSFLGNESWTNEPYYSTMSDDLTFFADVTGDGRAHAIVVDDNRVTVRRSTGSGFGAPPAAVLTDDGKVGAASGRGPAPSRGQPSDGRLAHLVGCVGDLTPAGVTSQPDRG